MGHDRRHRPAGGCYLVTAAGLTGVRASARALLIVAGLAERLTSSIQTCWPFIIAVALRRSTATGIRRT